MKYTLFHIYSRFQVAILTCSPTLTSSCANIRPTMLFDAKHMRIPFKFHVYSICYVRFKCFRFHVRHFDCRLNSHRIVGRPMLLSAAVTSTSSKTNAATLNLLPNVIFALWFNGHQVYHIFPQKIIHTSGDVFRYRVGLFQKSQRQFHHALMALGIRRSQWKIPTANWYIQEKRTGCNFVPPAVRGLTYFRPMMCNQFSTFS